MSVRVLGGCRAGVGEQLISFEAVGKASKEDGRASKKARVGSMSRGPRGSWKGLELKGAGRGEEVWRDTQRERKLSVTSCIKRQTKHFWFRFQRTLGLDWLRLSR